MRANLPIERRGSNVYIRVIFDQFGETLYKAGAYVLDELELNITRITHIFVVSVGEAGSHINYLCFSPSFSSVPDLHVFGYFLILFLLFLWYC